MATIKAAEMIKAYHGPEYLVEPVGCVCDADDVEAINADMRVIVIERDVLGWAPYNAIVHVQQRTGHGYCDYDGDFLAVI